MNQPMVQLARPDLTASNIDHMNSKELRSLAKELRVNSHMNGKDEFSTYDDASISNDEWKALIRSPPTTTTHVNICIIKPMTKKGDGSPNGSYARRVQQESPQLHYVGKPTDFISHAWRYNFVDLVRAVESEADERDRARAQRGLKPIKNERYYWNDIFVEDQNATMDKPEGYFFTAFREAIVSIGRTVLILMPLKDSIPLTRAWCVWEMFCTIFCFQMNSKTLIEVDDHFLINVIYLCNTIQLKPLLMHLFLLD